MAEGAGGPGKLCVFISYSRDDLAFADQLDATLRLVGFETAVDRHGIHAGEQWEPRLGALIRSADTVVFVLTQSSARSKICEWEVEEARRLGKRIMPVVPRPLGDAQAPPGLAALNYIFFYDEPKRPGSSFGSGLLDLVEGLKTDLEWLREHTRLLQRATEWEAGGRQANRLLSGDDIAAAKAWVARRPKDAPELTTLHLDFIRASEEMERARQSAEQQRLDQIGAAQAEREKALEREQAALQQAQTAFRRTQRAQSGIVALLACIIVGLIGWINQAYLKEQWTWHTVVRPYMRAHIAPYLLSFDAEKRLRPGQMFRECDGNCPEMIVVPAGSFVMGSPETERGRQDDEGPQHEVAVAEFAAGRHEVTFDAYNECVQLRACTDVSDSGHGKGRRPVVNLTWQEAEQYVAWFASVTGKPYRLLSEAEWEYAARAGTTTVYSFGDDERELCMHANLADSAQKLRGAMLRLSTTDICDDAQAGPAPVGSYSANAFGLHDMHGNVWEATEDCYVPSYAAAPTAGSAREIAGCKFRVNRGGSWSDDPFVVRAANRGWQAPDERSEFVGFRVGRSLLASGKQ